MFGAVIIPHGEFGWIERMHSIAVEHLFPPSEIGRFEEFHARDLFKGDGPFRGIEESKRFDAIRVLLMAVRDQKLPFIYGAIDEARLAQSDLHRSLFETAQPLIPAFKLCMLGVETWATQHHAQDHPGVTKIDYADNYMFIVDDTKDQEFKKRLRSSYRMLRSSHPYTGKIKTNRLWHAHDAMLFVDSVDSVGIQLADLCTYFMQRHLLKRNPDAKDDGDEFYRMFAHLALCAKPEPEFSRYRDLLLCHNG